MPSTPTSSNVSMTPTSEAMPGGQLAQTIINWLGQAALWGSLGSILLGACIYGISQHAGNYNGSYKGRQLAIAGVIGACLTGLAPAAINIFYNAATAGK
jgi:hypothetical protein